MIKKMRLNAFEGSGRTAQLVVVCLFALLSFSVAAENKGYYYHNDHLGTPLMLTDKDQNVVWQASYDPFGNATVEIELVEQPFRLPGQYYDSETGYLYNYFRDYDATLGRYIQSDPIGLDGGLNTYGYVGGNPIRLTDPFGLAKPQLGSGVETHNGGKPHVHWGKSANPRANAINQDGSVRHGKSPPSKIKKAINEAFGWNLKFIPLVLPFAPETIEELIGLPEATDPWADVEMCL